MCKAYGIFGPLRPSLYYESFFSFVSVGYIAESFGIVCGKVGAAACPSRSDSQRGPYTPVPRCAARCFGSRVPEWPIAGDLSPVQAAQLFWH